MIQQRVGIALFCAAVAALIVLRLLSSNAVQPPQQVATPTPPVVGTPSQTTFDTPPPIGTPTPTVPTVPTPPAPSVVLRAVMPSLVTIILLGAALWVILSRRYNDANQKWAFGVLGTIIGYWLNAGG